MTITSRVSFASKLVLLAGCFFILAGTVSGQEGLPVAQGSWEKPYVGSDPAVRYFPDRNAVYFRYGWQNNRNAILVIKGSIPKSRYYSYNIYDDQTKGSLAALADYEIRPDDQDPGTYTIYVVSESIKADFPNQIRLPDSVRFASVVLRYYLPQGGVLAGVTMPDLTWKEADGSRPVAPSLAMPAKSNSEAKALEQLIRSDPGRITKKERQLLGSPTASMDEKEGVICKVMTVPIFKHQEDQETLHAYNYNSSGNYPNKDNHYIVMPVVLKKKNVLFVRFKAPTYAKQLGDTTSDVRYFSLSEGNEYTNTSITLHDEQLRVSRDGFVYVVVAEDSQETRAKAIELGINFMPLLYKDRIVLILRHMLPSPRFTTSAREVPVFDNQRPVEGQQAGKTIGAFALVGRFVSQSAWASLIHIDQIIF